MHAATSTGPDQFFNPLNISLSPTNCYTPPELVVRSGK